MAKKANKGVTVNVAVLQAVMAANEANTDGRVTQEEGIPLLEQGLIIVNKADVVEGKAAARITDAGKQYLSNLNSPTQESASKPMFDIIQAKVVIPASQRGNRKGAGAPTQYPFADMAVGDTFFVPDSAKKGNAAKHLGSTVSQQNMHYREEIPGKTKEVERTKRGKGNKAEVDAEGNKIKEKVTVPEYKQTRKFVMRAVKAGQVLGEWTAPEDGALIGREM